MTNKMYNNGSTSKQKAKKNQKSLGLQNTCQPSVFSTACNPGTYEGSPSPYDNTMAEDDSSAVTRTGGPPPNQYMMSTAVSWDRGEAYSDSQECVGQQPTNQQQTMTYESPYYTESHTGTQGASNVVYQQPGLNERMAYEHCGYTGGEGQHHPHQQYGGQQSESGHNGGGERSG